MKLTGSSSSIIASASTELFIDGLNILPIIPSRGDDKYISDGFILLICFDNAPNVDITNTYGYTIEKFSISCTAQLAVL